MQHDPLAFLDDDLQALNDAGLYRTQRVLETEQAARVVMDDKPLVTLSTNNYLGLTTHPRLKAAAKAAIDEYGVGAGSVRTIAGTMSLHEQLEVRLAAFKHAPAALTYQSGYATNLGLLSALLTDRDVVVSDELNHASIIDGLRLSPAKRLIYAHCDLDALETRLREARELNPRLMLVITDGVFSMDGDIAPLPGIVALAEQYGAAVMVDDAHSSGVLGRNGRGTVDHFDLHGRVALQVGTLSKAIGAVGGYVAGSVAVRNLMIQRSRAYLFTTALPPSVAATCLAALDVLEDEPQLLERLWENTRFFQSGLRDLGFDTGRTATPITPVMVGDEVLAASLSARLFDAGVFAQPIIFPMVARGNARLRAIVTAGHSRDDLAFCLETFAQAGRELGIIG
ncbi:MAG: glycine C-acetyltransferase [Thermomicrobiales bacterium]